MWKIVSKQTDFHVNLFVTSFFKDAGEFYAKYKETRLKKKEDALTRAELETLQSEF